MAAQELVITFRCSVPALVLDKGFICSDVHAHGFSADSGRVAHGFSGGIVLNENKQIIGLIKAAVVSLDEDDTSDIQGFVPIHVVIEDLEKH